MTKSLCITRIGRHGVFLKLLMRGEGSGFLGQVGGSLTPTKRDFLQANFPGEYVRLRRTEHMKLELKTGLMGLFEMDVAGIKASI
jgi:hypothetical protein